MKKDAYYFPHFCNARHDRKIKRLRKELGIEGYGIYFMILEVLRDQVDFKYPYQDIDLLSDEFDTSFAKMEVVIKKYELFEFDKQGNFYSPRLILYMQPYLEKTKRARDAANKRWSDLKGKDDIIMIDANAYANAYTNAEQMQSKSNASAMQGKERKGDLRDLDSLSNDKELSAEPTKKCPYQQILDKYHSICTSFPKVQSLTDSRKKTLQTAWKQGYDVEYWVVIFTKAMQSDFLSGRSGQWTGCGFDWIIKPSNRAKIFEGNYDARQHVREFPF